MIVWSVLSLYSPATKQETIRNSIPTIGCLFRACSVATIKSVWLTQEEIKPDEECSQHSRKDLGRRGHFLPVHNVPLRNSQGTPWSKWNSERVYTISTPETLAGSWGTPGSGKSSSIKESNPDVSKCKGQIKCVLKVGERDKRKGEWMRINKTIHLSSEVLTWFFW